MKKWKIWVDDIRPAPKGYLNFKTVNDTIAFLKKFHDSVELLDLDHDAGIFYSEGGDYIKILDWLEAENISIPISIHSGNPVGIRKMKQIISHCGWTYVSTEYEIY